MAGIGSVLLKTLDVSMDYDSQGSLIDPSAIPNDLLTGIRDVHYRSVSKIAKSPLTRRGVPKYQLIQSDAIPACVFCGGNAVSTAVDEIFQLVIGFRIEYVLFAVVVTIEEVELVFFVVVVALLGPTPTQYAYPVQKFWEQSDETSGFHLMKSSWLMPNFSSTQSQKQSPLLGIVKKALQLSTMFGCVGPSGDASAPPVDVGCALDVVALDVVFDAVGFVVVVAWFAPTPTQYA